MQDNETRSGSFLVHGIPSPRRLHQVPNQSTTLFYKRGAIHCRDLRISSTRRYRVSARRGHLFLSPSWGTSAGAGLDRTFQSSGLLHARNLLIQALGLSNASRRLRPCHPAAAIQPLGPLAQGETEFSGLCGDYHHQTRRSGQLTRTLPGGPQSICVGRYKTLEQVVALSKAS